MNIILFGYGKMGRMVEQYATARGHSILLKVDSSNMNNLAPEHVKGGDVVIDFSIPEAVLPHIEICFAANVPIVVGTTGWYAQLDQVKSACQTGKHTLLYASNFSIGVNIFFHINKMLAKIMNNYPSYDVQLEEIHHTEKKDSPSGTAITLAEGVITEVSRKIKWVNALIGNPTPPVPKSNELLIESHRIANVPGTHSIIYSSEIDNIELKHTAHSRAGFAMGAVVAAEWVKGKTGFFSIEQLFNF